MKESSVRSLCEISNFNSSMGLTCYPSHITELNSAHFLLRISAHSTTLNVSTSVPDQQKVDVRVSQKKGKCFCAWNIYGGLHEASGGTNLFYVMSNFYIVRGHLYLFCLYFFGMLIICDQLKLCDSSSIHFNSSSSLAIIQLNVHHKCGRNICFFLLH